MNQKMFTPQFTNLTIDQIDVERDIISFKFLVREDLPLDFQYHPKLANWTEN